MVNFVVKLREGSDRELRDICVTAITQTFLRINYQNWLSIISSEGGKSQVRELWMFLEFHCKLVKIECSLIKVSVINDVLFFETRLQ